MGDFPLMLSQEALLVLTSFFNVNPLVVSQVSCLSYLWEDRPTSDITSGSFFEWKVPISHVFNSFLLSPQCDPALLPEPNHVMLNHLYALSIKVTPSDTIYNLKFRQGHNDLLPARTSVDTN